MTSNGRLDVSTLVDWDGHQNYLDPEAARQWIAARNAYASSTGYWLYTSECYRPVGNPGDLDRGAINTQWYWKEWWTRAGKPGNAAAPGTNSTHGWAKGIDLVNWPERAELESILAAYGWEFNIDGEPWHCSYVGNPSNVATVAQITNTTRRKDMLYIQDTDSTWWLILPTGQVGVPTGDAARVEVLDRAINQGDRRLNRVQLGWVAEAVNAVLAGGSRVIR